jgi:hypothetical protein
MHAFVLNSDNANIGELTVNKKTVTIKTATIVTAATAAMLAGLLLTGCSNTPAAGDRTGGNNMARDPGVAQTTTAAQTTPAKSGGELSKDTGGAGSCNHWPGVSILQGSTVSLRLAASNTESYGHEDPGDAMAVLTVLKTVSDVLYQLPAAWAEAIRNQVILPGSSADPSQMYAAANNAQSLALQLSQLCYTP